jgi:hypothetical protein
MHVGAGLARMNEAGAASMEPGTRALHPIWIALAIYGLIAVPACKCYGEETQRSQLRGFGMVARLGRSPEFDDQQIKLMRVLGVSVVLWSPGEWAEIEKIKGQYAISPEAQRVIRVLAASNIKIMIGLFRKNGLYANPLDADAFAKYSAWLVKALKNQPIVAYQIWNEPSNFDFRSYYGGAWNGVGDAPWLSNFVTLMGKAARAIKQADPRATVLVNLEGPPLVFALRARPQEFAHIDGVSIHPYAAKFPPEQVPWGGAQNYHRDGVAVADSDGSLVSSLHFQADDYPKQYLGRPLQTWVTEYGFPTCDPATHPENYNCVSPREQAAFHARGMIIGFSNGARLWSVYELADEGAAWSDPEQNFGITGSAANGYVPKPAFLTLQRIARILGSDWSYLPMPSATLATSDGTSRPAQGAQVSHATTVSGPQMAWFSTAGGYAGFIWKAGPYDDATTEARVTVDAHLPSTPRVIATDLVTGQTLQVATVSERGALTIDHLPLGSRPVVLELLRH